MTLSRTLGVLVLLVGLWTAEGLAQAGTPSPHGKLTEGLECSACHTSEAWSPLKKQINFDHDRRTSFVLTGKHAEAACSGCHLRLHFDEPELSNADCASCHLDVHQDALSDDCAGCHNTVAFNDLPSFDVHAKTSFPLVGAHLQIGCQICHIDDAGGAFSTLDTDCASCHLEEYQTAASIDHVERGFSTDCQKCHSPLAWSDVVAFEHAVVANGFALVGAHARLRCESCHIMPDLEPIFTAASQNDCITCHQDDYQREHDGTGFTTTCLDCHTTDTWVGPSFDHAIVSNGFELVGGHSQLACESCHLQPGNELIFTPANQDDCVACHLNDFQREHADDGFADTCLDCHTVDTWERATFDHANASNGFDLIGIHDQLPCSACHIQPGNQPIFSPADENDCITCHQNDYDQQHAGTGFSTNCLDCHQLDTWQGAAFDHTFPIDRGPHSLENRVCSDCHIDPNNTQIFECVLCHDHNQQKMDDKHSEVSGYVWDSQACLSCHPNGKED